MRVTTKSDYALRALIEIANVLDEGPISAEELGRRQDIPKGFLQSILADLRRAGVLASVRGNAGGWKLNRPAHEVSVADVIRAVDGPLVSIYGQRPESVEYDASAESLQQVWIAARYALREVLEHVTIKDLAAKTLPHEISEKVAIEDAWNPH
ncbi:BadM/Rrf2 family transcriptional regulator [Brevibacterium sanguinis]|uniref:BadM/Rrf2 family transcriptional regulator n=2 Tax=Brevibacterium TaxID=1696 RepID=A0A366IP66_9MICO|nr:MULTISPECIES: Rrf2 family transcriptional regulator [Brevibacterium]RBP67174.1 BadM/Rrf2 family transcriptional regulator [Brevibacterium sanguinis]RBP73699.1 BadM/Rrf2 family transcriptional regulator [Brevibacterium celere]